MDPESLKIFVTVADALSITQAAARLGRAPSNVTTRMQQLEADVGAALFIRTGKRITLSESGVRFLEYAQRLLALAEEARHVATAGRHGGTLRIGTMEATVASRLGPVLASFNLANPGTRIALTTGPSADLLARVRSGMLDCAFIALPQAVKNLRGLRELGLMGRKLWREDLVLLLPAQDARARRVDQVRTRALAAFRQGCTYRERATSSLRMEADSAWVVHEMNSYHAMIACVAAGACVTLLPASVLALSPPAPALGRLASGHADTYLIWREGYDVPSFRQLLATLACEPQRPATPATRSKSSGAS